MAIPSVLAMVGQAQAAGFRQLVVTGGVESPTPIQGRWKIDGLGLSETVLRKLYGENAARLLKWKPPVAPAAETAPNR